MSETELLYAYELHIFLTQYDKLGVKNKTLLKKKKEKGKKLNGGRRKDPFILHKDSQSSRHIIFLYLMLRLSADSTL